MNGFIYLPDVVTLSLCEQTCNGCGICVKVCPHEVFEISGKKAHIIRKDHCMECGACAINCQTGAISVRSGVGCAAGIINGILRNTEPTCDCSGSKNCC
ncbi:MAG TPA: mercury methylation ferredoxin HgcB [Bacteroidales bacterium]|jgi:NAD-dependent dihydropyrimidine dehydrogenase PreA subunit|nr:mercury methylation ferredoxin HgcB [Bacteroidales bacterium]